MKEKWIKLELKSSYILCGFVSVCAAGTNYGRKGTSTWKISIEALSHFSPLNPKGCWHLISSQSITPQYHIEVKRIREMIISTKEAFDCLKIKFSLSVPKEIGREQYGEYAYWYKDVKGWWIRLFHWSYNVNINVLF